LTVPDRLSVAVVQGGASMEAEVSRASARGVADALANAGHGAVRLELDARLAESLRTGGYDVVFPVAHGAVGEDGALQGLLEVLDLPYVGSGVLASALAMDKSVARRHLAAEGLPVARGIEARRPRGMDDARLAALALEAVVRAHAEVGPRLVVKPSSQGSALGVARFDEGAPVEEVSAAVLAAWKLDDVALLEHFARGREITCGVLDVGEGGLGALPPTEIASPRDAFYTYEARYAPGRSVHTCPADIGDALTRVVQSMALAAHRALGCRDLSRLDLILGDGTNPKMVTLLEVNTMPGFTPTSLYPEAAAQAGLPLGQLCDALVRTAHARGPSRRHPARPLPT
jgi:D-alanine-D-alanine ligase